MRLATMSFAELHDAVDKAVIDNPIGSNEMAEIVAAIGRLAAQGVSTDDIVYALRQRWPRRDDHREEAQRRNLI